MKIYDIPQGSPEWLQLRCGIPSASRFREIFTAKTGALSTSSLPYMEELIGECFVPGFVYNDLSRNPHVRRGNELEPEAREIFATETGLDVHQVGFVQIEDGISGCSPDGLILGDGNSGWIAGLEIKCPTPKVHIRYHSEGKLPDDYRQQVHGSMVVTGLNVWHFMSYCPGMAPFYHVEKADEYTRNARKALRQFEEEYQALREKLVGKLAGKEAVI